MNCAEAYVRFLCQWLLDHCLDDMEFMQKFIDKSCIDRLKMVASSNFVRITYTEAVAILKEASKERKFENKVEWGIDLASEHERYAIARRIFVWLILYIFSDALICFLIGSCLKKNSKVRLLCTTTQKELKHST